MFTQHSSGSSKLITPHAKNSKSPLCWGMTCTWAIATDAGSVLNSHSFTGSPHFSYYSKLTATTTDTQNYKANWFK